MELVIVLVIKCIDCITFVCLESLDCTLNICFRLFRRAEFLSPALSIPPNRADAANTHASKFLPMAIPQAFCIPHRRMPLNCRRTPIHVRPGGCGATLAGSIALHQAGAACRAETGT